MQIASTPLQPMITRLREASTAAHNAAVQMQTLAVQPGDYGRDSLYDSARAAVAQARGLEVVSNALTETIKGASQIGLGSAPLKEVFDALSRATFELSPPKADPYVHVYELTFEDSRFETQQRLDGREAERAANQAMAAADGLAKITDATVAPGIQIDSSEHVTTDMVDRISSEVTRVLPLFDEMAAKANAVVVDGRKWQESALTSMVDLEQLHRCVLMLVDTARRYARTSDGANNTINELAQRLEKSTFALGFDQLVGATNPVRFDGARATIVAGAKELPALFNDAVAKLRAQLPK